MRDLPFVACPTNGKPKKRHPLLRRLRRSTPMLTSTGCGKNSRGFGRAQTPCRTGAVRRTPAAAARLRRCATGPNTGKEAASRSDHLSVFKSLGRRAEQHRAPMHSIGARQGVF